MLEEKKKNVLPFNVHGKQSKMDILFKEDMWWFMQGPRATLTSTWTFLADCSYTHALVCPPLPPKQSLQDYKAAQSNFGLLRPRGQRHQTETWVSEPPSRCDKTVQFVTE